MFSLNDIDIQTKEELTMVRVLEDLVSKLEQPQSVFGDQKFLIADETKKALEWTNRTDVPHLITDDYHRRSIDIDYYFSILANAIRRDLLRIIEAYGWLNKLETKIEQTNGTTENIEIITRDIINTILTKQRQTSILEDNIQSYDFRSASDVESGGGYQNLFAGIVTTSITDSTRDTASVISITTDRPVYDRNIYADYTDDTVNDITPGTTYYDMSDEPLKVTFKVQSSVDTSIFGITMNVPFEVESIKADVAGNNNPIDITSESLGRNLTVRGTVYAEPTSKSIVDQDGNSSYAIVFPVSVQLFEVTILIEDFDLYPFPLVELVDNHGERIKLYDVRESKIIRKELAENIEQEEIDNLFTEIKTGINPVNNIIEMLPLKQLNITLAEPRTLVRGGDTDIRFKTVPSLTKISSVEIYVDSHDPLELVQYFIDSTRDERIPISPVNANPVNPIRVDFEGELPTSVNVIASIPSNLEYLPLIHSLAVRLKETVI